MDITLTDFRTQMFKLLPKVDKGETITVIHKNHRYVILPEEKAKKLRLMGALNNIPEFCINRTAIKEAIESGRK